jgi:hypothetical protein
VIKRKKKMNHPKRTIFIFLFLLPYLLFSQIKISGAFITWKDNFSYKKVKVVLSSGKDTLLNKIFPASVIPKMAGQYPVSFFEFTPAVLSNELVLTFSLSVFENPTNRSQWWEYNEKCPINNREKRIELEFHLDRHTEGDEYCSGVMIKKYYQPDSALLFLTPDWTPQIGNTPAYKITNNTPFKLFGQSEDGHFYADLYKEKNNVWERVYTGGYDYTPEPGLPLYASGTRMSWIADEAQDSDRFHLAEKGKYKYVVLAGFDDYEANSRYGDIVYSKAGYTDASFDEPAFYIKEYYELEITFEVK